MSKILKSVDCPVETVAAGTIIFQEGARGDCFYIVKEGEIGVYKHHRSQGELRLGVLKRGQVLGEISGIDGLPRTATAMAETDVVLTKVSAKTLLWQVKQCPAWFQTIVHDLVERLRATDELLVKSDIEHHTRHSSGKDVVVEASEEPNE